jgi:hypothetical protein
MNMLVLSISRARGCRGIIPAMEVFKNESLLSKASDFVGALGRGVDFV